jgi:excisionase family DNA binding protein
MIQMSEKLNKPLYSINEAKELLSVSDDTIRRMIKAGELDAVKVRGTWRIRRESLEKYLNP